MPKHPHRRNDPGVGASCDLRDFCFFPVAAGRRFAAGILLEECLDEAHIMIPEDLVAQTACDAQGRAGGFLRRLIIARLVSPQQRAGFVEEQPVQIAAAAGLLGDSDALVAESDALVIPLRVDKVLGKIVVHHQLGAQDFLPVDHLAVVVPQQGVLQINGFLHSAKSKRAAGDVVDCNDFLVGKMRGKVLCVEARVGHVNRFQKSLQPNVVRRVGQDRPVDQKKLGVEAVGGICIRLECIQQGQRFLPLVVDDGLPDVEFELMQLQRLLGNVVDLQRIRVAETLQKHFTVVLIGNPLSVFNSGKGGHGADPVCQILLRQAQLFPLLLDERPQK